MLSRKSPILVRWTAEVLSERSRSYLKPGKKYFQIGSNIEPSEPEKTEAGAHDMFQLRYMNLLGPGTCSSANKLLSSPDIIESRVSVFIADQLSTDNLDNWVLAFDADEEEEKRGRTKTPTKISDEDTIRILGLEASDAKVAGIPIGQNYSDVIAPLKSHPVDSGPVPEIPLPGLGQTKGPVEHNPDETIKIIHPSPRRVGSHPVLQRASSDVTDLRWSRTSVLDAHRSVSDTPGPPPPRSPLRTQTSPETIESLLQKTAARLEDENRKYAITSSGEPLHDTNSTKKTTVTFRSGSSPRPEGSARLTSDNAISTGRRVPKQSHSKSMGLIDTMIRPSQTSQARKRLRRARPEGPRPLDLSEAGKRASHLGSLATSPTTTSTLSPKQAAALSNFSDNVRVVSAIRCSSPKPGHTRSGSNGIVKGKRSPGPRPRSARIVPTMDRIITRSDSPAKRKAEQEEPAPPSPPPKKELPPTPIEKTHRVSRSTNSGRSIDAALARASSMKALPSPPGEESMSNLLFPTPPSSTVSPTKSTMARQHSERKAAGLEERLAALERQNQLLEAALMAVLKTGGTMNGCPCKFPGTHHCEHADRGGLTTHGSLRSTSSSTGSRTSALDMYLNTRGK